MAKKFCFIIGPTASGKSDFALLLAQKIGAVIVNSDSQQIYSELPILSASPTAADMALVPHYLYGALSGRVRCSAGMWLDMVLKLLPTIDRPVIFVGGTGLYLHTLLNGIAEVPDVTDETRALVATYTDEKLQELLGDKFNVNRRRNIRAAEVFVQTGKHLWAWQAEQPEWMFKPSDFLITVMNVSRETIYEKINNRFTNMINAGALDEVRELMKLNLDPALPIMTAHGLPELIKYIKGEISLEQATEKAQQNVRNYAKRQLTWIRNQLPHKVMHDQITADDVKKFLNS